MARLLFEKGYVVHGIKRRSSSFNTARAGHGMELFLGGVGAAVIGQPLNGVWRLGRCIEDSSTEFCWRTGRGELALTANDLEGDEDLGDALFKIALAVSAVGDEVHRPAD